MERFAKHFTFLMLFFIIANLAYLDVLILFTKKQEAASQSSLVTESKQATSTWPLWPTPSASQTCPGECQALIDQATASAFRRLPSGTGETRQKVEEKPGIGGPPQQTVETITYTSQPTVREFYIPLGAGKTTKSDWADISGTDTTVDTALYGKIKEAYFEVNAYVPTGNGRVSARLYDVTDKHPAWFAEVSTENNKSTFLRAGPIVLEPGAKVYRVQLLSSLGAEAVMDNARVKIVVE